MSDKRRYMRFNVFLEAICRTGSGLMKKFKINDFSREGLGVESYDAIPEGEDLEIELMIPGDNMPVVLEGELAWCAANKAVEVGHKSGIRLKNVSNADRSRLLGYIYNKWIASGK